MTVNNYHVRRRILVTGGAGFLGSHLAERLVLEGHRVVGLDSFDAFYDRAIKERNLISLRAASTFSMLEGDIRDRSALDGVPSDVTLVVHLAAKAGVAPDGDAVVAHQRGEFDPAPAQRFPRLWL